MEQETNTTKAGGRRQAETTDAHPIPIGALVAIQNTTMGGQGITEGVARIVSRTSAHNRYNVEFTDEKGATYVRFALPGNIVQGLSLNDRKGLGN